MKLATSTNIMNFNQGKPYQIDIDVPLKACAEAGYQYVDAGLSGFCRAGQALTLDNWENWAEKARMLSDELGLEFAQAHAYWTIGNAFHPDGSRVDGEWGEELLRRSVLTAETLGCKWAVVHPYSVDTHDWYDYKKSFEYNREYFKRWGDFFAAHNVGMAIENMNSPTKYCSRPEELLELINAINNPLVEICIDTGHSHMVGIDVADMIRQVGSHLKATHIADNHGTKDEHFAPFNGTIDWPSVMKALSDVDYQECFAFEIQNLSSMYPKEAQPALVKFSYDLGKYLLNL